MTHYCIIYIQNLQQRSWTYLGEQRKATVLLYAVILFGNFGARRAQCIYPNIQMAR